MRPEVSVVLAVYNGEKFIAETLQSIYDQTFSNWECIVVNDGSHDRTREIVESFCSKDKRYKYFDTEGGNGPYISANIGIRKSLGKFIARIDADDVCLPNRLELQYSHLIDNKAINVCGSLHMYLFEDGSTKSYKLSRDSTVLAWQMIFRNSIVHSTMMFRKTWIESIGYYPELFYSQDWYIWLQAIGSESLSVLYEPLVKWRIHDKSITKLNSSEQFSNGAKVAYNYITKNLDFHLFDLEDIEAIVASIRGTEYNYNKRLDILIQKYIEFYLEYRTNFSKKQEVLNEFHEIIYILYSKYSKHSMKALKGYFLLYYVDGVSVCWLQGVLKLLIKRLKLCM